MRDSPACASPSSGLRTSRPRREHTPSLSLGQALLLSCLLLGSGATATAQSFEANHCESSRYENGRLVVRSCDLASPLSYDGAQVLSFIRDNPELLGTEASSSELELSEDRAGIGGFHTHFQQMIDGIPVYDAFISINVTTTGRVQSLYSTYRSLQPGPSTPLVTEAEAEAIARAGASVQSTRLPTESDPVWFPRADGSAVIAWQLMIYAEEPLGDFLSIVDAQNGKLVLQENRMAFVSGTGLVYDPSPIQTSGNTSLVDNNDQTSPALDAERIVVTLQGLDADTGTLRGEYVDLVSLPGGKDLPDADEPSREYLYDRSDSRFEQVVIYHAVDSLQRYIHSLGFDDENEPSNGIRDFPTLAHAHWFDQQNSFYSTGDDAIHLGDGGTDHGEDGDVIIHEYGHAIQHNQNACWGGGEMGAMGEGFSDYLAASFYEDRGDALYQAFHAPCVAEWSFSHRPTDPPCLRRVDGNKIYPRDKVNQVHADGEMWSRALWDIRSLVGGVTADRMILEHHFHLPCNATMVDAAHELVATDLSLNGGANEVALRQAFCDRGIFTGADCTTPSRLTLAMSVAPNPVRAGQVATYRLDASNVTGAPLTGLTFAATVPSGSEYLESTASHGGGLEAGSVLWPPLTLAAGESISLAFDVTVDSTLVNTTLFVDDMEAGPGNFVVSHGQGTADWTLGTTNNHGGGSGLPDAPGQAWFASDPSELSDQYLTLASDITIGPKTQMRFWHDFTTERGFDGGRVEFSQDQGTTWFGTDTAQMIQTPYNSRIHASAGSPIASLRAFSGSSNGYVETIVDLDAYAGSDLRVRFRMASDGIVGSVGWYVDDVHIGTQYALNNAATVRGSAIQNSELRVDVVPSTNTPPTLHLPALPIAEIEQLFQFDFTVSDPDPGDAITVILFHGPSWLEPPTRNADGSWTLSGTPTSEDTGDHSVILRAVDDAPEAGIRQVSLTLLVNAPDQDGDGLDALSDNCAEEFNPDQLDLDGDGCGDVCDADYTQDGTIGGPDFAVFAEAFRAVTPDRPGWDPLVDHDRNGKVGGSDFTTFTRGYRRGAPGPSFRPDRNTTSCP